MLLVSVGQRGRRDIRHRDLFVRLESVFVSLPPDDESIRWYTFCQNNVKCPLACSGDAASAIMKLLTSAQVSRQTIVNQIVAALVPHLSEKDTDWIFAMLANTNSSGIPDKAWQPNFVVLETS